MNANKDEAQKCVSIARKHLVTGDRNGAKKFVLKAMKLDPSINIEGYTKKGTQENEGSDSGAESTGNKQPDKEFTKTQIDSLRKVLACKNYYEILGVSRTASDEEIKKAFKLHALKFHPDKNRAPGAAEAFKKIKKAYEVLIDPEKRQRYDQYGAEEEQIRSPQVHRHGDTFFQYDADVFTMFFNGGFPFSQVYRDHRHRPHRSRESEREASLSQIRVVSSGFNVSESAIHSVLQNLPSSTCYTPRNSLLRLTQLLYYFFLSFLPF
ncbi:unnamed protein product [Schistosoma margrebowiei]|uniref:Uncharacterized protein n=1 Tax=Schistosoma margrebowiei TaxID=48269 RepID=A0A183MRR0_9TREM|nr:unnamed protein product [Schistosoma margrebowiei]